MLRWLRRALDRYPFRGRWAWRCVVCRHTFVSRTNGTDIPMRCPDDDGRIDPAWIPRR